MKKVMSVSFALLTTGVVSSCAPTASAGAKAVAVLASPLPEIGLAGYDADASCKTVTVSHYGDLEMTRVGVFPKADDHVYERREYHLTCPGFTIQRDRNDVTTIQGLEPAAIDALFSRGTSERAPYFWDLGRDLTVDLTEAGMLKVKTFREGAEIRPGAILAFRQGGGALKPFVYKGQANQISYDPAFPLEIYRPDGNAASRDSWGQVIWDSSSKTFSFMPRASMPK